jgi:cytochrome c-type biogenesis protein CcmH/NrfG
VEERAGDEEIAIGERVLIGEPVRELHARREVLGEAVETTPNDAAGWVRLAHSYNVLGEPEKARDAIAHAVRLKPNDKDVQLTLAETQKALAAPGRQRMIP